MNFNNEEQYNINFNYADQVHAEGFMKNEFHKQISKRKSQPAWSTSDLNKIITERNKLLKKAIKSQKVDDWSKFKKSKNMVTRLIRQSKKDYFKTQVAANRNNPKKLWKLIKNLTREDINKQNFINSLEDKDGKRHTDNREVQF